MPIVHNALSSRRGLIYHNKMRYIHGVVIGGEKIILQIYTIFRVTEGDGCCCGSCQEGPHRIQSHLLQTIQGLATFAFDSYQTSTCVLYVCVLKNAFIDAATHIFHAFSSFERKKNHTQGRKKIHRKL